LDYDESADLIASYGDLLAERDAIRAELATVKAALPRWHEWRDGFYSLKVGGKAPIGGVNRLDDCWRSDPVGAQIMYHHTRDEAMTAV
jgi:hypothetical protein